MPKTNGIGTSNYTPIKAKLYTDLVEKELGAIKGIFMKHGSTDWKRNTVLIVDTTAGKGYHKTNDSLFPQTIDGSFTVVLKKILRPIYSMMNIKFISIELNQDNADELTQIYNQYDMPENISVDIIAEDNKIVLDRLIKKERQESSRWPRWQYGWIYNDPSGNVPEFEYYKTLSQLRQFKTLDYIINIPTTTLLRVLKASHCHNSRRLNEHLKRLNKNYWWINDTPHGYHRWSMAFGSNWSGFTFGHIGINGKYRFVRTDTDYGEQILNDLSMTRNEKGKSK